MSTVEVNKLKKPGSSAGVDEVGIDYVVHGTAKCLASFNGKANTWNFSWGFSSLMDYGTGDYAMVYTNPFANNKYAMALTTDDTAPNGTAFRPPSVGLAWVDQSWATQVRSRNFSDNVGGPADVNRHDVAIHGGEFA